MYLLLIGFKPHCLGEHFVICISFEILTSELERIHEQLVFP